MAKKDKKDVVEELKKLDPKVKEVPEEALEDGPAPEAPVEEYWEVLRPFVLPNGYKVPAGIVLYGTEQSVNFLGRLVVKVPSAKDKKVLKTASIGLG